METQVTEVQASNPIADVEAKIAAMKPRAVMKEARKVSENWAKSSFELGALLYRIKEGIKAGDTNFKYESFPAYVEAELIIKEAHANNFIRVYREFTEKKIALDKVAGLPFSSLIAAVHYLTADNVDTEVPKLAGMTYKQIVSMPEVQAAKNQIKAKGGTASAASKAINGKKAKAAAADDADVIDVQATDVAPAPAVDPVADYAKSLTVEQLTALLKAIPKAVLIEALNASKVLGLKLSLPAKSAKSTKQEQPAA